MRPFLSLLLVFSTFLSKAQLEGEWRFKSIEKNDTTLFTIGKSDSLRIFAKDSFYYQLAAKNLSAYGQYSIEEDSIGQFLSFHYLAPSDTTRFYRIVILNDTTYLQETF